MNNDSKMVNDNYINHHVEIEDTEVIKHTIYNDAPKIGKKEVVDYLKTRFTTLFDIPMLKSEKTVLETINPFPGLSQMKASNWNFYFLGFFAWTVDSFDFFLVSASAPEIAESLGVSITDITWGVTLVLMLRSVGAFIFGLVADTYGRKWPFIIICIIFSVIELGTGFIQTYKQFLGVRAIFGIAMGAMYPVASTTALEDQPPRARSILSGFFLPGYNFGYLLAVVFYRAFQFTYKPGEGWRSVFWFSAGVPVLLIIWRLCFPESESFVKLKKSKAKLNETKTKKWFDLDIFETMRTEWLMFLYLIFLMSGFNFMSHGSQDLYPTLLTKDVGVTPNQKTVIMVVVNLGAMCGGIFFGQLTELLGRRLTIIICCICSGAFLYPSFFLKDVSGIIGGYFFLNFCVMGAWGVAPLHLFELVNTTHRAFLSGLVYQLGNLASSASSTIEAKLGAQFPKADGTYDYGRVMCIFCGAVFAYMTVVIFFGPERFHKNLDIQFRDEDEESNIDNGSCRVSIDESKPKVYMKE